MKNPCEKGITFEIGAVQKYASLVDLEKCCQTHILLQDFVLIQPRTSPPKICKQNANYANFANNKKHRRQPAVIKGDRQGRGRLTPAEGDWTDDITGGWYEEFESNVKAAARRRQFLAIFRQNFARFRLYRRQSLQENTRFAAFQNLPDYLAEIFEIWQTFAKLQQLQNVC